MAGSTRGLTAAWLLTCSTTPDIYGTGQPARERSQGSQPTRQKRGLPPRLQDQHDAPAGAESPHSIPSGRQDGGHTGAFRLSIAYLSSDWSEFRAVTQNREVRMRERRSGRAPLPENPYRWPGSALRPTHVFFDYSFFNDSAQLLLCGSIWGRSSETARMQDSPSNWIRSAE